MFLNKQKVNAREVAFFFFKLRWKLTSLYLEVKGWSYLPGRVLWAVKFYGYICKIVLLYFMLNWKVYFFTIVPVEIQAILQEKPSKPIKRSHYVCDLPSSDSSLCPRLPQGIRKWIQNSFDSHISQTSKLISDSWVYCYCFTSHDTYLDFDFWKSPIFYWN